MKQKSVKLTVKEYKIENAPIGTRFIYGGHSTLLIVTDGKEISCTSKSIICVSESGMLRKIPYGTKIKGLKEAKHLFIQQSSKLTEYYFNK